MTETDVKFDLDPARVERLELRGVLAEDALRTDQEFPDHREHFLKIDELPERLSVGLSEDERRLYDITYYLRKDDEPGKRYQIQVKELADSINRSLVFEFEYFDPAEEHVELAVSRLLDSVKRIIDHLDQDRYREFRMTRELYGCDVERLFEKDTSVDANMADESVASEDGVLDPENLRF